MPKTPRRHWYQDRPTDHLHDLNLAQCGLAGRGAFMVLRDFIRVYCDPGRLAVDGIAVPLARVAQMFHVEKARLEVAVTELLENKVARQTGDVLELPGEIASAQEYDRLSAKGARLATTRWQQSDAARMEQSDAARMELPDAARMELPDAARMEQFRAEKNPSHSTRARASGSRSGSGSGSGSGEGGTGEGPETEAEPHIPSVEEFIAGFMADGMPEEWLRRQWEWFQGNGRWLTKAGRLTDFRVIVRGRWRQDRAGWQSVPASASASPDPKAELARLRAQLERTEDPEKRTPLRRAIYAAEDALKAAEKPQKPTTQ